MEGPSGRCKSSPPSTSKRYKGCLTISNIGSRHRSQNVSAISLLYLERDWKRNSRLLYHIVDRWPFVASGCGVIKSRGVRFSHTWSVGTPLAATLKLTDLLKTSFRATATFSLPQISSLFNPVNLPHGLSGFIRCYGIRGETGIR